VTAALRPYRPFGCNGPLPESGHWVDRAFGHQGESDHSDKAVSAHASRNVSLSTKAIGVTLP
jgi:hypothetical protein